MKKIVITGGPCSGKTTIINELKRLGFSVLEEQARKVLEEFGKKPRTRKEWEKIQIQILEAQLKGELGLGKNQTHYFDRGIQDTFAYCRHSVGKILPEFQKISLPTYSKILILDRLPFQNDGLRVESGEDEAMRIHEKIISEYQYHRYNPIIVPLMPVNKRVRFILSQTN